jgi:hypothetical protein
LTLLQTTTTPTLLQALEIVDPAEPNHLVLKILNARTATIIAIFVKEETAIYPTKAKL